MADEPQTPPQGDPAPSTPPNPQPQPTSQDSTPPPGDPEGESPSALKKALDAERAARAQAERDAKARAKELTDAQARLKELDDAQKSDAEKALARAEAAEKAAADLQNKLKSQAVRHAVAAAAQAENFHKPESAFRYLDLDSIEVDADGEPQGIDALVKQLAKDEPYLVKPAANSGPPPTPKSDHANGALTPDEQRDIDRRFALHTRSRF